MPQKRRTNGQSRSHPAARPMGRFGGPPKGKFRYAKPNGPRARGPTTCPMCGAPVADLRRHIAERHDDAASHPRA